MKVGITTHYYKSKNYGGNLQAYALVKAIEKCGYTAEQICFPLNTVSLTSENKEKNSLTIKDIFNSIQSYVCYLVHINRFLYVKKSSKIRANAVSEFNEKNIPHSATVYTEENINEVLDCYDVFITGSDCVWNPKWFSPIFFLNFVPQNVPKFSYAPSLGISNLNNYEKEVYKEILKTFQSISVRESNSVELLSEIYQKPVELVLDPTLLFDQNEWNEICSDQIIQEPYLFCYFLGDNQESRNLAKKYAEKHNLLLVTIPFLQDKYRYCDYQFGDYQIANVSPKEFISLIKYADCVFTDSFHSCVFSFIYQKEFYAFKRNKWDNLGSRVSNFLGLIGCESRYCDSEDRENINYIEKQSKINYEKSFSKFEEVKRKSWQYLKENLMQAENLGKETINESNNKCNNSSI